MSDATKRTDIIGWFIDWFAAIFQKPADFKTVFGEDCHSDAVTFYQRAGGAKTFVADILLDNGKIETASFFASPIDMGSYWILANLMESEETVVVVRKRDEAVLVVDGMDLDETALAKETAVAQDFGEFLRKRIRREDASHERTR